MQKTRGGSLIFVAGILYIIFGAITLIVLALGITAISLMDWGEVTAPTIISLIFPTLVVIFEFGAGIYAVRHAHNLSKAGKLLENAIALLVITIISLISDATLGSLTALSFINLILPLLMLAGANINKKAAQEAGIRLEKFGKKDSIN